LKILFNRIAVIGIFSNLIFVTSSFVAAKSSFSYFWEDILPEWGFSLNSSMYPEQKFDNSPAVWMLPDLFTRFELEKIRDIYLPDSEFPDLDIAFDILENQFLEGFYFANSSDYLHTPTYDGSGQAVHPDVVYFSEGWQGYKYWMAFTPYPFGKKNYENPSILASQDGLCWEVPPGLENPIIGSVSRGYHADPDLLYNHETDELWFYFMRFKDNKSYLYRVCSSDGINWSEPELILEELYFGMLSPSIVYQDGVYHLWYVDSGRYGIHAGYTEVKYRTSSDGVKWSQSKRVNVDLQNHQVWHLEISYIPALREYWMVFPGFEDGGVANRTDLFFARAVEPTDWIVSPDPILIRSRGKMWDNTRIYRASFLYDENTYEISLWYSAAQRIWSLAYYIPYPTYVWRIGHTVFTFPFE
jgi:hypothetical protein